MDTSGGGAVGCEREDALLDYVYDECDAAVRDRIAAHVGRCPACAGEVATLRETREQLLAWAPPEVPLGVRLPRVAADDLRLASPGGGHGGLASPAAPAGPWWQRPLPAWAQVAAAGLIFVAGLAAGGGRAPAGEATSGTGPVAIESTVAADPARMEADLARLEERLRADLGAAVRTEILAEVEQELDARVMAATVAAVRDDEALWRRVEVAIEESEGRQRLELARRAFDMAREFEARRVADLYQIEGLLGQQHSAILHLAQHVR